VADAVGAKRWAKGFQVVLDKAELRLGNKELWSLGKKSEIQMPGAGAVVQAARVLKHEALSSNPSDAEKKRTFLGTSGSLL
jgi:hypothetical protein